MSRGLSLYLDLLRFIAAFEVFLFHIPRFAFSGIERAWWNSFGHEAVIVFFVLSGYLITYAAEQRDKNFKRYCVSRTVRIYSVAIPALALTLIFDGAGRMMESVAYLEFPESDRFLERLIISLLLINQSWFFDVQVFSNTPYWSIAYEFWYYFIFGSAFFLRGWKRIVLVMIFMLIAGPKVMLLFPIWLFGSIAYKESISIKWPVSILIVLVLSLVPATAFYLNANMVQFFGQYLADLIGIEAWREGFGWSRYFISDLFLGLFLAVHLMAIKHFGRNLEYILGLVEKPLRWAAAYTFTLYLIHQPAALFVGAFTKPLWGHWLMPWILIVCVVCITVIIGYGTERHRGVIAKKLTITLDKLSEGVLQRKKA